jgi:periplasmic divalent cation tolerance protein
MQCAFVYVTAPSEAEALRLAESVVGERLAACANILPGMASVYWWDGTIHRDNEASLVLKTRLDLVDRLTMRLRELHPYDCPCIVALPIVQGNPDFLAWIVKETLAVD